MQDDIPGADAKVDAVVAAVAALADHIADHYDIQHGSTTSEGKDFGGLASSFYPKQPDQVCPEWIDQGDEGGDWEMRAKGTDGDKG